MAKLKSVLKKAGGWVCKVARLVVPMLFGAMLGMAFLATVLNVDPAAYETAVRVSILPLLVMTVAVALITILVRYIVSWASRMVTTRQAGP